MDHQAKAYGYAIRLLSYRDRTRSEIEERLAKKGFEGGCVAGTIQRLEEENLLDDLRFALNFCRDKVEHSYFARQRLAIELESRGIREEIVQEAVARVFQEYDEPQLLRRAIKERICRTGPPHSRRELSNLIQFLTRRGFPHTQIWTALRTLDIPLPINKD